MRTNPGMEQQTPITTDAERAARPEDGSLHLIACVAGKAEAAMPACQLYRSDWFRKARHYCESWSLQYAILSAEYGLVLPNEVIAPYDRTLLVMPHPQRQQWAEKVRRDVAALNPRRLVLLAGRAYREPFTDWTSCPVSVPMAGMGIGDQKHWLSTRARTIA